MGKRRIRQLLAGAAVVAAIGGTLGPVAADTLLSDTDYRGDRTTGNGVDLGQVVVSRSEANGAGYARWDLGFVIGQSLYGVQDTGNGPEGTGLLGALYGAGLLEALPCDSNLCVAVLPAFASASPSSQAAAGTVASVGSLANGLNVAVLPSTAAFNDGDGCRGGATGTVAALTAGGETTLIDHSEISGTSCKDTPEPRRLLDEVLEPVGALLAGLGL